MVVKTAGNSPASALVDVRTNNLRFNLHYSKSSTKYPTAHECDATKASFIFFCPAQKNAFIYSSFL